MALKRRVNLPLPWRAQASGSRPSLRARLAATNSTSPSSSASRAGSGGGQFGLQLVDFAAQLTEHGRGVGPIEADAGGAGVQLQRLGQGREPGRDAGERAGLGAGEPLGGLMRLPAVGRIGAGRGREDVGVAADHLVGDGAGHVGEGEGPLFLGHARIIDDLQQQIAQFVGQRDQVAGTGGVGDLVGFFDGVGSDRGEGLHAVPRAAGRRVAQGGP